MKLFNMVAVMNLSPVFLVLVPRNQHLPLRSTSTIRKISETFSANLLTGSIFRIFILLKVT
jgi:hypothetical protein